MSRSKKSAVELVSDIGQKGYYLQQFSDAEIAAAVEFLRKVNPEMFDWIAKQISPDKAQVVAAKAQA